MDKRFENDDHWDNIRALEVDKDGFIYIAGTISGKSAFEKYNSSGNLVWSKELSASRISFLIVVV